MNNVQEYADVFTSSDEYARRFSGELGQWLVNRQSKVLRQYFSNLKPENILDVAGGHGHVANPFSDQYKVTVLGSIPGCDKQINAALTSKKCAFEAGDIEKLKYSEGTFDAVTCLRYLSHTDNWQAVIKELCRVAKKAVIVDFPPLISFNILTPVLFKLKKRAEGNTRDYKVFTKSEIVSEFNKHGFSLQSYRAQFFFPMVVHRLLDNPTISACLEFLPGAFGLTDLFGSPALACFIKNVPV